jgi:hypothetical protein
MYHTDNINYDLAGGDFTSNSVQLAGSKIMTSAVLSDIIVSDIKLKLQQSIDGENWGDVPDSEVTIAAGQTSQSWNVIGLVRGSFLRLSGDVGSAVSGTVNDFKILSPND